MSGWGLSRRSCSWIRLCGWDSLSWLFPIPCDVGWWSFAVVLEVMCVWVRWGPSVGGLFRWCCLDGSWWCAVEKEVERRGIGIVIRCGVSGWW